MVFFRFWSIDKTKCTFAPLHPCRFYSNILLDQGL